MDISFELVKSKPFNQIKSNQSQSNHQSKNVDHQRTLIANQDINEGTPIISIPNQALLNITTLPTSFKDQINSYNLTSFQTISYYLSKRHPNRTPTPKNQAFQEYINTLPRSFQEIPLCLILEYFFGDLNRIRIQDYHLINPIETRLSSRSFHHSMDRFQVLGVMTSSMKEKCDEVTQRFLLDWRSVSGIKTDEDEEELVTLDQFLWGWLNVNTRCLWFDLGLKDHDDNITLAPVIDMVNHTLQSNVKPIATPNTFSLYSSHPNGEFGSPTSKNRILSSKRNISSKHKCLSHRKGDEILFSYGSHSNSTLWSEYGFIIKPYNRWNSIDITSSVLDLFMNSNDHSIERLSILKESNYWKDYTIESTPIGPSYRTLTSLRLLYCPYEALSNWYKLVNGEIDELDQEIESQVKVTIEEICVKLMKEIDENLFKISDEVIEEIGCVKDLMVEEKEILKECVELMNDSGWRG